MAATETISPTAIKTGSILTSATEDNALMNQILGTHDPDGLELDFRPLLQIVQSVFDLAAPSSIDAFAVSAKETHIEAADDETSQARFMGMSEALTYVIDRISHEVIKIKCKNSGAQDAHNTAVSVLDMLSNYPWDAKLVLVLSAFALNYGKYWLVIQNYTDNRLATSLAVLQKFPKMLKQSSSLKPQFDEIRSTIKVMLNLTKCIVDSKELPSQHVTVDAPTLSEALALVPLAVYWGIRSVVACASLFSSTTSFANKYSLSTTAVWELSIVSYKMSGIHSHLATELAICQQHIDEKKQFEAYEYLLHLFDEIHSDNLEVLKALINPKADMLPLVDGATKTRVSIDVLRRKNLLLLISDLEILHEEIAILEKGIYNEFRNPTAEPESQYEIVWLPTLDQAFLWTERKQKKFESLQATMPWYTVHSPSLIDRAVIKFIEEVWHFHKKTILVVLDPQGRVVSPNALHAIWIWVDLAFPFTSTREEDLWKEETWRLELLVDAIDPVVLQWISEGRYVCLYGGEEIEWIREFTTTANEVAVTAGIPLGMVYVGKSNLSERVRKNIETIGAEGLSHYWEDPTSIWHFWARIKSMWYSKVHLDHSVENDQILQEIVTLLSYENTKGGWALLSKGSSEMVRERGTVLLTCLSQYNEWEEDAKTTGFLQGLKNYRKQLNFPHYCNRFVLPGVAGKVPERVTCSGCGHTMKRLLMYQCCSA